MKLITAVVSCLKTFNSLSPLKGVRVKGELQALAILAAFVVALPACTTVNTFPAIARAGDTVSVMVGGTDKARKETIAVSLTDINGQTWDLKALGLVRSVFNLRTEGDAYGAHYSSYLELYMPWNAGHEPMQTVLVADLPAGVAPGMAYLTISLNATGNSSGIANPFKVNLEIMSGVGKSESFSRQSSLGPVVADLGRLEPAPYAKITFGTGTAFIGAASLRVAFNNTVLDPNDVNVYVPESTVRGSNLDPGAFGATQRMVYWRHDGQYFYLDVVAPQGINPRYLQLHMVHPRNLVGSVNFSIISATVYGVDGLAMAVQPTLQYFP